MADDVKSKGDEEKDYMDCEPVSPESMSLKSRLKSRTRKRKRMSDESNSDIEEGLPENTFEVEKNLHASAIKNNLDEQSVKKILKKVVTNDHVLALVKIREEEETKKAAAQEPEIRPKLTRSKVKELKKASPKSASWDFDNLELTPIKHIPVKTRPEVTALIAQELPDDEDDEEYQPTHDEVPSDDDHMSCSDMESQPRTPATPQSAPPSSPQVITDGPFKVPLHVSSARRRLDTDQEEEATIALRTRSKLSLSETPIEHIESSFIPPDELPFPDVDDEVWTKFIEECFDPKDTSRHEDDEDADPEYSVAADPDAPDEDEDAIEGFLKIPKKELNDLATELFHVMKDYVDDSSNNNISLETTADISSGIRWEGKQEPKSEDELAHNDTSTPKCAGRNKRISSVLSIGKSEPPDFDDSECDRTQHTDNLTNKNNSIEIVIQDCGVALGDADDRKLPPLLKSTLQDANTHHIEIRHDDGVWILPQQIQIFQQQLRMHIQLATSNFLQLHVHPVYWARAHDYKSFVETFTNIVDKKPDSVSNVCNLRPALELIGSWESSVSTDTPQNRSMVQFVQKEVDRGRRRSALNAVYVGHFHETFQQVVANSSVFLYPFLLPPLPYKDDTRRHEYLPSEDALIALGLEQFSAHVLNNPEVWKLNKSSQRRARPGYVAALELVSKCMFPHIPSQALGCHIKYVKKSNDAENPINKFFAHKPLPRVEHKLIPFNPNITLYQQPEHEMPLVWVRHIATRSKRAKNYLKRKTNQNGFKPEGVTIEFGKDLEVPKKEPLHPDFTKTIHCYRKNLRPVAPKAVERIDIHINQLTTTDNSVTTNTTSSSNVPHLVTKIFKLTETNKGLVLEPCVVVDSTKTTSSISTPICVPEIIDKKEKAIVAKEENMPKTNVAEKLLDHCECCIILRKILKLRQTSIKEYFCANKEKSVCPCKSIKRPKITNKLELLISNFKDNSKSVWSEFNKRLVELNDEKQISSKETYCDSGDKTEDFVFVTGYLLKLIRNITLSYQITDKKSIEKIFTKFDLENDCPMKLVKQMEEIFDNSRDLCNEFLAFLTNEQAELMGRFKEYFVQTCLLNKLMKEVDECITNTNVKLKFLSEINSFITEDMMTSSCDLCSALLKESQHCPKLAQYVFNLFPHKNIYLLTTPNNLLGATSHVNMTNEEQMHVDYEADHSSSGEDNQSDSDADVTRVSKIEGKGNNTDNNTVKQEYIEDTPELSITDTNVTFKQDDDDSDDSSENSMKIMSDESTKWEPPEWKRNEDKIILEILKQTLTVDERKKNTGHLANILKDKNTLQILSEKLTDKKHFEIRERVYYLLEMLSEK